MDKFNGASIKLCDDAHDLSVYYDESCHQFYAYCRKCGISSILSAERLDEVFDNV